MRVIDADALITQIVTTTEEAFMNASWKQGMTYALGLVETQPTIQPKKGTWIDTRGNEEWYAREYECSECGGTMLGESNFCPNCGAKMEDSEDETN